MILAPTSSALPSKPSGLEPSRALMLVPATRISVFPLLLSISKAYVPESVVNPPIDRLRSPPNRWVRSGEVNSSGMLTPVGDGISTSIVRPSLLMLSASGPERSTPGSPTSPTVPPVVLMAYFAAFVPCFSMSMATPASVTLAPNSPAAL